MKGTVLRAIVANRLFPPFLEGRGALALFVLRVVTGLAFILHGWPKIQNPFGWMGADSSMPSVLQALAALSEFGGGLGWILGLLTPLSSFGIACTMAVAASKHIGKGDPFVGRGGSWELAALYLALALVMFFVGPGRFALDALLFRDRGDGGGKRAAA